MERSFMDDMALVRKFVQEDSEDAFRILAERHTDLAYSIARRHVLDPHLAEEVVQTVLILLARKARTLRASTLLPIWIFRATQYAAANLRRAEARRKHYEAQAVLMETSPDPDPIWEEMAPLLDTAIHELSEKDRNALILRYFADKPLKEIGVLTGIGEEAARKRVSRGLEKLRLKFARRGVAVPVSTLSTLLAANAVHGAPATLAQNAATVAVLHKGASGLSFACLMSDALQNVGWLYPKTLAATIILSGGIGTSFYFSGPALTPPGPMPIDASLTDLGNLELENAHVVSGRVILAGGERVPLGTEIALARKETADSRVVAIGPEGEFSFTGVPPESIAISLNIPGYFLSVENAHLDRLNGDAILGKVEQNILGLELRLEPGQFKRAPGSRELPWDLQPWQRPFSSPLSPSL